MTQFADIVPFPGACAGSIRVPGSKSISNRALLLAALCALIFIPVSAAGLGPSGSLAPVSVSLVIGALMFGTGMQLANGCG